MNDLRTRTYVAEKICSHGRFISSTCLRCTTYKNDCFRFRVISVYAFFKSKTFDFSYQTYDYFYILIEIIFL